MCSLDQLGQLELKGVEPGVVSMEGGDIDARESYYCFGIELNHAVLGIQRELFEFLRSLHEFKLTEAIDPKARASDFAVNSNPLVTGAAMAFALNRYASYRVTSGDMTPDTLTDCERASSSSQQRSGAIQVRVADI